MKKSVLFFILVATFKLSFGQTNSHSGNHPVNESSENAKWNVYGNAIDPIDVLGTTNNYPLNFVTNNITQMILGTDGVLQLKALAGISNRVLIVDANGNLTVLPGSVSTAIMSWDASGGNVILSSGNLGLGTSTPAFKLDVVGDARISNDLYVGGGVVITDKVNAATEVKGLNIKVDNQLTVQGSSDFIGNLKVAMLAGTGDRQVVVDGSGNLKVGNPIPTPGVVCTPGSPEWNFGGNNLGTIIPGITDKSIGTCDAFDFVLKANNSQRLWIKADGKIGFNLSNPSEQFHFSGGNLRIDGSIGSMPTTPAPYNKALIVNGDVVLANYVPVSASGNTDNGVNGIEFLGGDDGTGTIFPTKRGITVDANPNGHLNFYINTNQSLVGFNFKNGNGNKILALIDANGHLGLNIQNSGTDALSINDVSANKNTFKVTSDGKIEINYQSSALGSSAPSAIEVKDISNTINFKVKSSGSVYAREVTIMALTTTFPDYVFDKSYKLVSLSELENYININKRLPGFKKGIEYEREGINVNDLMIKQQEKIEELTLYIIELEKRIKNVEKSVK